MGVMRNVTAPFSVRLPGDGDGSKQPSATTSKPHLTQTAKGALERSISQAGMRLLTSQFVSEVQRVLGEQKAILPLLSGSRAWALKTLNRQFYAIRTASEMLRQSNLAAVAGRGEVLVSLLSRGLIDYRDTHLEVLEDTWALMSHIISRVAEDGSDSRCFSTAKTAVCLHAAAEPMTQDYMPAKKTKRQSPRKGSESDSNSNSA